jgi:hypothetical protein
LKKCKPDQIEYLRRQYLSKQRLQLRIKGFLKNQAGTASVAHPLKAPSILSLDDKEARSKLLKFLEKLRKAVNCHHKSIRLDLSHVTKLYPAGTLLFFAEVSRLVESEQITTKLRCTPPRAAKPRQVFKQLGLFELLNCHQKVTPKGNDVIHWRLAKGNDVRGEKFEETVGRYDGKIADALSGGLYNSMVEAMKNSKQHAYLESRNDCLDLIESGGPWWMLSQQKDGNLYVAFCDLGIGIPRSLPKKWQERVPQIIGGPSDSEMIRAAAEIGRTRTDKNYRGHGLSHICEDVMDHGGGRVLVHSNKGRFEISHDANGKIRRLTSDFKDSILGTIIIWKVALGKNND